MERACPIRSVSRSIAVLRAINQGEWLTLMEISKAVGLPYPTTFRIIKTLMHEGLVVCEAASKRYRVTALVQSLAAGYSADGRLVGLARPHLEAMTRKHAWPMSLTTRVGRHMVVRDSTHTMSSLTFSNYAPGFTLPLLECASGHAVLAAIDDATRHGLLAGLEAYERRSPLIEIFRTPRLVANIRENGYATWERNPHTPFPGKTSSIAVPVTENGQVVAAMTLVFFASAMPMAEAVKRFAGDLRAAAAALSAQLSSSAQPEPELMAMDASAELDDELLDEALLED